MYVIPQHVRFSFEIFQPILGDIAHADDVHEVAVGHHGQLAHALAYHRAHGALEAVAGDNLGR